MLIFLVAAGSLWFIRRFDVEYACCKKGFSYRQFAALAGICCINERIIGNFTTVKIKYVLFCIVAGGLVTACATDIAICQVHNFVWWGTGMAGSCMLFESLRNERQSEVFGKLISLLLFILIQQLLFSRLYGRADCYAFSNCAIVEYAQGYGFRDCLFHMLLAVILLAIVQMLQKNMNRKGNLKKPVAFLPYITFSFWLKLFFVYLCKHS